MFKKASIANATSLFTKAAAELKAVADAQNVTIDQLDGQIERLAKERLDAFSERDAALAIASKIEGIIS